MKAYDYFGKDYDLNQQIPEQITMVLVHGDDDTHFDLQRDVIKALAFLHSRRLSVLRTYGEFSRRDFEPLRKNLLIIFQDSSLPETLKENKYSESFEDFKKRMDAKKKASAYNDLRDLFYGADTSILVDRVNKRLNELVKSR